MTNVCRRVESQIEDIVHFYAFRYHQKSRLTLFLKLCVQAMMTKIILEGKTEQMYSSNTLTHRNKSKKIDEPYLICLLLFIYTYAQSRLTLK